jgi:hypothetical protein
MIRTLYVIIIGRLFFNVNKLSNGTYIYYKSVINKKIKTYRYNLALEYYKELKEAKQRLFEKDSDLFIK